MSRGIEKPRNLEDVSDQTKTWELTEIVDPTKCRTVTMPDNLDTTSKVLLYYKKFILFYVSELSCPVHHFYDY